MPVDPLTQPCAHTATPEEQHRDPGYICCNAGPGQPCLWATRHDGVNNPVFHSERLEATCNPGGAPGTLSEEAFNNLLGTGLV